LTSIRRRVVVEAPASCANLGPGFDVFALALDKPRDRVTATVKPTGRFSLTISVDGGKGIPTIPRLNSAGAVALSIAKEYGLKGRVVLEVRKGVPVGIGLGSSGASSAGAAVAMNQLFNLGMGVAELIKHAGAGENAASGATHLDNVTASIVGGFVVVPGGANSLPITFKPPSSMALVIVTPRVSLPRRKTAYARSLLPGSVKLSDMTHNISRASLIIAGFASGNVSLLGEGMDDAVVEIARKKMVPGYDRVKASAKKAGASGVCISGAGPSVLAVVDGEKADPKAVLMAIVRRFKAEGVTATGFETRSGQGAFVIESN